MRAAPTLLVLLSLCSCGQLLRYTDELTDRRSGRSPFVTVPASAGGFVGFVAGIPFDVVALPVTYSVYSVQKRNDPATADPLSTMLFPSFVLWRGGTLIAAPLDAIEHLAYRRWLPEDTLTEEERRRREYELDEETLPQYPVEPIYPPPEAGGEEAGASRSG